MADLELLDQSVVKLLEAAAELPPEDIEELIAAERLGKTRRGAMDGLEALLAPDTPDSGPSITNCLKGTVLHLGDGRKLAYGESDEVSAALAAQLRESGQAE